MNLLFRRLMRKSAVTFFRPRLKNKRLDFSAAITSLTAPGKEMSGYEDHLNFTRTDHPMLPRREPKQHPAAIANF
jgi:hypothetical protein